MRRYIDTKASTSILTYRDKYSHRHMNKLIGWSSRIQTHSSQAWLQNLVSLTVIVQTLFRRVKVRQRGGQTEQSVQRRN